MKNENESTQSLSANFPRPTTSDLELISTPPPSGTGELPKTTAEPEQDVDADPLSDHANFLSFEEWKNQMLKKAGQSPDHVGTVRSGSLNGEPRRRPGNINNALDSLGEDSELELDFSGFVNPDATVNPTTPDHASSSVINNGEGYQDVSNARLSSKSKDAGKTCKERFNYASFDCAATVLKTNPECKGSTAVLVENKDSYMLNECSASNKFFITELCNDILIDTVVLGNFEFFSSTFRTFRVSVSDRYPVKLDKWRDLGTYEAKNTREVQAFLVENPLIWARYLRIEFLTHYGNEYYCPVSLLRVHGKTMMDDYRHDVKVAREEEDIDDDESETEEEVKDGQTSETTTAEVLQHESQDHIEQVETASSTSSSSDIATAPLAIDPKETLAGRHNPSSPQDKMAVWFTYRNVLFEQQQLQTASCNAKREYCDMASVVATEKTVPKAKVSLTNDKSTSSMSSISSPSSVRNTSETTTSSPSYASNVASRAASSTIQEIVNGTRQNSIPTQTPASKTSVSQTSQPGLKTSSHPPAAAPTTQESFFKSIHKRLQLLESNSTLSLQYIEEQSRILREAFTKVEKRQLAKTTTFLEVLNTTVLSELREFRLQYDQIWQSTVLELSSQREQSQCEVVALSARLSILADEILLQKRMAIVQFFLILLCLGLVIFSRTTAAANPAYLELQSTLQNMVSKPSTSFSRYLHLDNSPPGSPSSRPGSRYGLFSRTLNHVRGPSDESNLDSEGRKSPSPAFEYSPPTPTSQPSNDDGVQVGGSGSGLGSGVGVGEGVGEGVGVGLGSQTEPKIRRVVSSPELQQSGQHEEEEDEADKDDDDVSGGGGGDAEGHVYSEESTAQGWKPLSLDLNRGATTAAYDPPDTTNEGQDEPSF